VKTGIQICIKDTNVVDERRRDNVMQVVVARLIDEDYGLPILQVQEIIKTPDITRIPNMPDFMEGVINLRGRIVPILDLHKRFNLETMPQTEATRVVVTSVDNQLVGLVVDSVSEVLRISETVIEPVPSAIAKIGAEYLSGVAKLDKRLIILLNIQRILTDLEKQSIKKIETNEKENNPN
jgi:purine-binding chemotaxis protein CheW